MQMNLKLFSSNMFDCTVDQLADVITKGPGYRACSVVQLGQQLVGQQLEYHESIMTAIVT
jgi:hypothetical protein